MVRGFPPSSNFTHRESWPDSNLGVNIVLIRRLRSLSKLLGQLQTAANSWLNVCVFTYLAELTEDTVEVPRVMRCNPLCSNREALWYGFWALDKKKKTTNKQTKKKPKHTFYDCTQNFTWILSGKTQNDKNTAGLVEPPQKKECIFHWEMGERLLTDDHLYFRACPITGLLRYREFVPDDLLMDRG